MTQKFALSDKIDVDALAERFARLGSVSIEPFLAGDQAQELFLHLKDRNDWRQVINSGEGKVFEFDRAAQAGLSETQKAQLAEAVYAGARDGFQFRYETIRVPDEAEKRIESSDPLCELARFMSSGKTRDVLRSICGDRRIEFADAQATAYSPGDFLTGHDDDVAGKNRSAAYVLSLNPRWKIEWGGLFLMHGEDGMAQALAPVPNRLNLFRVPQMHSVSEVTRAAPNRRYSVTGWLRR